MLVYLSIRKTVFAHEHVNFKSFGSCLWTNRKVGQLLVYVVYFKQFYTYISQFCLLIEKCLSVIYLHNDQNSPCFSFSDTFSCQNTFKVKQHLRSNIKKLFFLVRCV
jgi:hypothetical protein